MKTPRHSFLIAAMALAGGAFLSCTEDEPDPTIEILFPTDNMTILDSVVVVRYRTTHFTTGHVHVDTDSSGGTHVATPEAGVDSAILNLPYLGPHYIVVNGSHANHAEIHGMRDSVAFTIDFTRP